MTSLLVLKRTFALVTDKLMFIKWYYRWKALSRLVGFRSRGPSGKDKSPWRTERKYSRVMCAWPMARADRYRMRYPLFLIFVNNWATPLWAQSFPTMGRMWPSTSDLLSKDESINYAINKKHHDVLCDGAVNV